MEKVTIKLFKATQNIPTSKGTFENALLNALSTMIMQVFNQNILSYFSTKTNVKTDGSENTHKFCSSKRAKHMFKTMAWELTTIRVLSSFEKCMFNYNVSSRTNIY